MSYSGNSHDEKFEGFTVENIIESELKQLTIRRKLMCGIDKKKELDM